MHSLSAGGVTQATMTAFGTTLSARQTVHKTVATLRPYIRTGEIFRENAAGLGV